MDTPRLLVVADDLTGAVEAGALCAAAGLRTTLIADPQWQPGAVSECVAALVVDTETRHATALEAAARVEVLARWARGLGVTILVKKTDSTLRGNIAAELAAVAQVYGGQPLLYVPAYPRLGRIVRGGTLFVDGQPVAQTGFARDPLDPVRTSSILWLLRSGQRGPVFGLSSRSAFPRQGRGIWVVDGGTEADIARAARWLAGSVCRQATAGPADLVRHLAAHLAGARVDAVPLPRIGTCIIVNGSLHEVAADQVRHARRRGWAEGGPAEVEDRLPQERWMILRPQIGAGLAPLEHAAQAAGQVVRVVRVTQPQGLAIFGGDSALAILRELGFPALEPLCEVLPGVPATRATAHAEGGQAQSGSGSILLITKAGGFGPPDLLMALRANLAGEHP